MLVVIAQIPGKPDKRDEIAAVLSQAAAASRSDAGCLTYTFNRDLENEDSYVSVEVWEDQASLDAHFGQPHLVELMTKAPDLVTGPAVITVYDAASSRVL